MSDTSLTNRTHKENTSPCQLEGRQREPNYGKMNHVPSLHVMICKCQASVVQLVLCPAMALLHTILSRSVLSFIFQFFTFLFFDIYVGNTSLGIYNEALSLFLFFVPYYILFYLLLPLSLPLHFFFFAYSFSDLQLFSFSFSGLCIFHCLLFLFTLFRFFSPFSLLFCNKHLLCNNFLSCVSLRNLQILSFIICFSFFLLINRGRTSPFTFYSPLAFYTNILSYDISLFSILFISILLNMFSNLICSFPCSPLQYIHLLFWFISALFKNIILLSFSIFFLAGERYVTLGLERSFPECVCREFSSVEIS